MYLEAKIQVDLKDLTRKQLEYMISQLQAELDSRPVEVVQGRENPLIADLDISVRLFNGLRKLGVLYLADIENYTMYEFMSVKHLGKWSLSEMEEVLNKYGYQFK